MTPPISGPSAGLNAYVAAELRAARGRVQISVPALAEKAEVPYGTLRRYLNAERHIDVATLAALCDALDVTPAEIVHAAQTAMSRTDELADRRDRRSEMQQIEDEAARDEDH